MLVADGDSLVVEADDAGVGDRDAEDVAGEVIEHGLLALAPGRAMDDPGLRPDGVGQNQVGTAPLQRGPEFAAHELGQGSDGNQEGSARRSPMGGVVGNAASSRCASRWSFDTSTPMVSFFIFFRASALKLHRHFAFAWTEQSRECIARLIRRGEYGSTTMSSRRTSHLTLRRVIALDATVTVASRSGVKAVPFASLHRLPGATANVETVLAPGDLITGFNVPAGPWTRRSLYLKIRDRQSYEFALASAAVALHMDGSEVREARIALGGVATIPWRCREAEDVLAGKILDETSAQAAARAAFADARPRTHNGFKVALGKATLVRALLQAAELEG